MLIRVSHGADQTSANVCIRHSFLFCFVAAAFVSDASPPDRNIPASVKHWVSVSSATNGL